MSMCKVEGLQDGLRKCESCEYDHDVEDLVASTQDVEFPLTPPLGNLPCVNASLSTPCQKRMSVISTYLDSIGCGTSNI